MSDERTEEEKSEGQNFQKIHVVAEECTSCSLCYETLPLVYIDRGDGISFVHDPSGIATQDELQESIDECPGECIHWGPDDKPE